MDIYTPLQVYHNLVKLVGYRGATLVDAPLSDDEVVKRLNNDYVIISATRDAADIRGAAMLRIILLAPKSKYANKTIEFKKLLNTLPKRTDSTALEVLIVSENSLSVYIKQVVAQEAISFNIEAHDYEKFMIEMPKHESVPKHVLISDEEVQQYCREYYTSPNNFPKIHQSDTQAVWLGLRPGMVVKIYRVSETAGTAIVYRVCIRG